MFSIRYDIRIAIKGEKGRESFDAFDNVSTEEDAAVGQEIAGNEQP